MTEVEVIPSHDDADGQLDGPRAWCHVMYGLHALSAISGILTSAWIVTAFVFSSPSIVAVIINYATASRVRGTWLETHWRWQLRSFWFAFVWAIIAGLLVITIIGYPLAWVVVVSTGLWVLYRVTRGWLALADRSAMPLPASRAVP